MNAIVIERDVLVILGAVLADAGGAAPLLFSNASNARNHRNARLGLAQYTRNLVSEERFSGGHAPGMPGRTVPLARDNFTLERAAPSHCVNVARWPTICRARSRHGFRPTFFALWKAADEALPPLAEARAESARLR
jgi:hypothetical protein